MTVKRLVEMVVMEDHQMKQQIPVKMVPVEKDQAVEVEPLVEMVLQ